MPRASLSGVSRGTHITERILRSAIEALVGRFLSAPASWLRTAFFWPRTWLTIDRLMLIGTSSAGMLVENMRLAAGPVLEGLADQPLGLGVDEDQEEALGLGEQLHQRVEDLGRDGVDLELGREVAGDLEDRLELDLGLDQARHGARARGVERVKVGRRRGSRPR